MKGDETVNEFKKQFGRSWWVIRRKFIVGKKHPLLHNNVSACLRRLYGLLPKVVRNN